MTRPYSLAFKQKMVEQLTRKNTSNAAQLARQTGIRQQNLSRWLEEARSLPLVASGRRTTSAWTAEQKGQVITEAFKLTGEQLIKRVLGHSDVSVTAIYNRYGYVKEMRAGLERWARELEK